MSGLIKANPAVGTTAAPQPAPGDMGAYAEPVPEPAVGYITTRTPLRSILSVPSETLRLGAAVVNRQPNRQGEIHRYDRGAMAMPPGPMSSQVRSSEFQTVQLGPIVNVALNAHLYRCGFPASGALLRKNPGLSIKVAGVDTTKTGGPGPTQMAAKPAFRRVQTVQRYVTQPARYNTRSAG